MPTGRRGRKKASGRECGGGGAGGGRGGKVMLMWVRGVVSEIGSRGHFCSVAADAADSTISALALDKDHFSS